MQLNQSIVRTCSLLILMFGLFILCMTYFFKCVYKEKQKTNMIKEGEQQRGNRGLCDFYVATNCSCRFQWRDLAVLRMETFPNFTEDEDGIF